MKKLTCFVLLILFSSILLSCAQSIQMPTPSEEMIQPGDKIGVMTVEQSTEIPYQKIWLFCDQGPDEQEPHSFVTDCEVPSVSNLDILIGWFAKE